MSDEARELAQVASSVSLETFSQANLTLEPDSVIRYRVRRVSVWQRWLTFVVRLLQGLVVAGLCFLIPDITAIPFHNWKNPVVVFLLICYIGKTLVDTFFYDHYQP